ncbi:MAG TPA: MFS transporter [Acidimicrobiales bacterium]|nr:MFS transporter [Acidimicrobiales bacterium]
MSTPASAGAPVRLGLRANLAQFSLLVAVNALVGGMIGQERTVLPLLAEQTFGLTAVTAATTFIVAFGATKAVTNLATGALSDRYGRKPILVAGWLVGVPVPLLLMWAPTWGWVIAANVLLGVNQGMTWSTTVIMKIDLVGPSRRGLALGLNEAAGYGAVALTALLTGAIAARHGLRPEPFYLGIAFSALGLGLSACFVRETSDHVHHEICAGGATSGRERFTTVFARTSWRDPSLAAVSQAGLVNNAVDGLAWGILPLLFAAEGLPVGRIGVLAALYPGVWSVGQLVTGAWSDHVGRKPLIVAGMLLQGAALAFMAATTGFAPWALGAVTIGVGTALVYPTLIAAVGDVAHPAWRATAVGVYRLWRDAGYVVGGLLGGVVADALDLRAAVWTVAALSVASGIVVALRMRPDDHPSMVPPSRG